MKYTSAPAPPPPPGGRPPLTPMEKHVARLLRRSLTERQAAEVIGRSPNTVHVHVRNLYEKLGIRSRKQLLEYPGLDEWAEDES